MENVVRQKQKRKHFAAKKMKSEIIFAQWTDNNKKNIT